MILFFDPYDPISRAVLMVLHEYNIDFDRVVIDRSSGYEHLAQSIVELNPQLAAPAILDGSKLFVGLTKIEEHVAELAGRLSVLHNADPKIIAIASAPVNALAETLSPAPVMVLKRLFLSREIKLLKSLRKSRPNLASSYGALSAKIRASKITRLKKSGTELTLRNLDSDFGQFEDHIRDRQFVIGSNWTILDGVWASVIACLLELGLADFIDPTRRPAINAFFDRIADRPSFQNTIEPRPSPFAQSIRLLSAIMLSFISTNAVVGKRVLAPAHASAPHSKNHLSSIRGVRHGS